MNERDKKIVEAARGWLKNHPRADLYQSVTGLVGMIECLDAQLAELKEAGKSLGVFYELVLSKLPDTKRIVTVEGIGLKVEAFRRLAQALDKIEDGTK